MLTKTEAESRVAKGAAHLDVVRPGWFTQIDVGTLSLSSCERCVVGQFSGLREKYDDDETPFLNGLALVGLEPDDWRQINAVATAHGFAITASDTDDERHEHAFALLQDAWIDAIATRRHPVSEAAIGQPIVATR